VIDTDLTALKSLDSSVTVLAAGTNMSWGQGTGCGGNVIRGEQAISAERHQIMDLIADKSFIIVVAGLGGGVSTGGIRTLASTIRSKKIPAVFMLTTPFSFESFGRRKAAAECIDQLLPVTDILIRLPNDLLFSMLAPDSPVEEAFAKSCDELARTAIGLCGLLNCKSSLNADYASFMALLRGKKCQCSLGMGLGIPTEQVPDRSATAIQQVLNSPFLGGVDKMAEADAMIVSLFSGPGLSIGEMKRTLEDIASMAGKNTEVISGFSTAPFMANALQIAVVTIRYEEEEKVKNDPVSLTSEKKDPSVRRISKKRKPAQDLEQGMLELTNYSKGFFINTVPVMHGDEDLDIPTYQRRGFIIDKGNPTR
jgi:cell division protein FtsZ